ncbi:DUF7737 domain-containing protein [Micromonospora coerulea]|uniref:DUF7737 domain-containing protein n=1 Tax=Micromonospora coerulea TaxID=47856 RepID=UPI003FD7FB20
MSPTGRFSGPSTTSPCPWHCWPASPSASPTPCSSHGQPRRWQRPHAAQGCRQRRRDRHEPVFLPFEDDRLALILSKAFLLADDARITDPSIVAPLHGRR